MEISEVRCPSCNAVNLNVSHICIRCTKKISTPILLENSQTGNISIDQIVNFLSNGNDENIKIALSTIEHGKRPDLIMALGTLYQGRHPFSKNKVKVDDTHKAWILLALGMIGSLEAGKMIAKLLDSMDWYGNKNIQTFGCYAAGICQSSEEIQKFLLTRIHTYNLLANYFIFETLKRNGKPTLLKDMLQYSINDYTIADNIEVGYHPGGSLLGKVISATAQYAIAQGQENQVSSLVNILMFALNANPSFVEKATADVKRCWSLQNRIETMVTIIRKNNDTSFITIQNSFNKSVHKLIATCVLSRVYQMQPNWIQVFTSTIKGSMLTTHLVSRLISYDALVRMMIKNPVEQISNVLVDGLRSANPVIRGTISTSIIIHGLKSHYPTVCNLANDPNKEVRISLTYALALLLKNEPELAKKILFELSTTNSDSDVRALSNRILSDPATLNSIQALI